MSMTVESVLQRMMNRGWRPGIPASEAQVRRVEILLGQKLPSDYRTFLLLCGGGEPDACEVWRGLWRIGDLWSWNERYNVATNFPGLFAIGNQGFLMYALDFRRPERTPVVSLGLSSSLWDDVVLEAGSFVEWLDFMVPA